MIIDLPSTTVGAVNKRLVGLRESVGAMALGRVLTLVVVVEEDHAEEALGVASDASRQHPSRIVVVVTGSRRGESRVDGQIRVGGDAGASEIVVLRLHGELTQHGASVVLPLLLADSPVVAWWPREAPTNVASDPIGALATRRVTDAQYCSNPPGHIAARAQSYVAGDTDLTWTRITKWRGLVAAALDQPPFAQVTSVTVTGGLDSAATDLLAAWLGTYLDCRVVRARTPAGTGTVSVRLERTHGAIDLVRPGGAVATYTTPGAPTARVALPRREDAECLADELARLGADDVYERTLIDGLRRLDPSWTMPAGEAVARGLAPCLADAAADGEAARARTPGTSGAA